MVTCIVMHFPSSKSRRAISVLHTRIRATHLFSAHMHRLKWQLSRELNIQKCGYTLPESLLTTLNSEYKCWMKCKTLTWFMSEWQNVTALTDWWSQQFYISCLKRAKKNKTTGIRLSNKQQSSHPRDHCYLNISHHPLAMDFERKLER